MQESALAMLSRRRPGPGAGRSPCTGRNGTRASSGSSPRGSRTASTAPCSPSPPRARAGSRAPGGRSRRCTCAMRSTSSPSAHPGVIERFGGHAAAAGADARAADRLEAFGAAFEAVARELLSPGRPRSSASRPTARSGPSEISPRLRRRAAPPRLGTGLPRAALRGALRASRPSASWAGSTPALTLGLGGRRFAAMRFGDTGPLPGRHRRRLPPRRERVQRHRVRAARRRALDRARPGRGPSRTGIIRRLPKAAHAMEAEQLNAIENSLSDLASRTAELRRYL